MIIDAVQPPAGKMILKLSFVLVVTFNLVFASACVPIPAQTLVPSTTPSVTAVADTPTPTTVWFPPTATFTPFPTPTRLPPTPDMKPGIGEIILEDDFSIVEPWILMEKEGGRVQGGLSELTITISEKRVYISSFRPMPQLQNFYVEISVNPSFCQGQDEFGLLLRYTTPGDFYRFGMSCDGQARFDRIYRSQASSPQPWLPGGAIPIGSPSTSTLGVWAVNDEMRMFINNEHQFTIYDPVFLTGSIGIFARSDNESALTVNFRNLKVWEVNP